MREGTLAEMRKSAASSFVSGRLVQRCTTTSLRGIKGWSSTDASGGRSRFPRSICREGKPSSFECQVDEEQLGPDGKTVGAGIEGGGRVGIGAASRKPVLDLVSKDVPDRVGHFARASQRAGVKAIGKERPAEAVRLVEGARHAHGEPLHATCESRCVVGLDEQVDMIPLHVEVNDAEAESVLPLAKG